MKTLAIPFYQKTVSATKKYILEPTFAFKLPDLNSTKKNTEAQLNYSRSALRKHVCYFSLPPLSIPDQLDKAAIDYLREHSLQSIKTLHQRSQKLANFLHHRPLLKESDLVENYTPKQITDTEINNDENDSDLLQDSKISNLIDCHKKTAYSGADRELRQIKQVQIPRWKSLTYSKATSQLYLVSRLTPNFSVACRILYEIRKRCPLFVPHTFLDFASGLGTYTWAANTVWPVGCIREHYLVEGSTHMSKIAEFLLQRREDDKISSDSVFPGVRHRNFMPSMQMTGDLVMSGYVLLELAGEKERQRVVSNLWQRTTGFLVLIEEGTKAGFAAILEARDWLIQNKDPDMHIFAPCPHSLTCQKFGMKCNVNVRFYNLGLTKDETYPSDISFSYLVVSRGDWRKLVSKDTPTNQLPRIISHPSVGGAAIDADLCLPNGNCERVTFSKSGTDRGLYFFLKNAHAGDIAFCNRLSDEEEVDFSKSTQSLKQSLQTM